MRRNLHSRHGGTDSGQAGVRRPLLGGIALASLALVGALAATAPAHAQSLGGAGGTGGIGPLGPGGNGGTGGANGTFGLFNPTGGAIANGADGVGSGGGG